MNMPNKLSTLRILLVPIIIYLLLLNNLTSSIAALVVFVLAALTDKYDGYYARKYDLITTLGKILDPLADKMLIIGVFTAFVEIGVLSTWPLLIIVARELAVTGLRVVAADQGSVIPANIWGKTKTTIQMITAIALIINPKIFNLPFILTEGLVWLTVLITIYSGYTYFAGAKVDYS
ncbi:CDP-diacylglycerol--glycerol-3-phosphate 3-phosphatidyltransferase [Halanaerobium congolense]|uniref:CDP-diacylglycerol--glycerol-3-phosphate 3-phosphatidyltransferase n=1 Tax=Halanaerobium congolense TaxID=54121 RepID=A0A1G6P6D0_9FIRM|nr:CDP-diacylglycerol--glycerol-3-phosphate 3-phosphatidyltransferase [Halanaerobium congolense]KXS50190.1 MAG: CDP-diacylglycerol--glycerol-3-phosphate 3-phosphatidyltransferase [Halanaerobium sp. T82-1]OEG63660.1 MAG: CDP-diacylglycerol--glycerol-3-phosphate 3-phosphatidyltransferase [Halanaerobium sp. MDAL1]PXV69369.1 CDP-diacylglycerol--glycerol-3-phosphate 3-phosphatidyltransferase [Halanaerobium congolense]TDP11538.1 CDP-diacylglycerol--glycerol-3-phosphate 3-phosphatidyltransferase [Hala